MAIENTSKASPLAHLVTAMGGIEQQEAHGQRQLARSSQLPSQGFTAEQAKKFGIELVGPSQDDPIFVDVKLPEGMTIKPTDHAMWSDLIDASGKKIAAIFYKAAFYDRNAFISWPREGDGA